MFRPRKAIEIMQTLVLDASQEGKSHRLRAPQRKTRAVWSSTTHECRWAVTLSTAPFLIPELPKLPWMVVGTSLSLQSRVVCERFSMARKPRGDREQWQRRTPFGQDRVLGLGYPVKSIPARFEHG